MISLFIFFAILGVLIIVHELGHFIMSKRLGVRVEKFSLGFGPRLIYRKNRGTEYSICAIPLGGYVKLAGDTYDEFKGNPDEYLAQAPGKRFKIIFFGPLLNYILGFLCFWLIFFAGYPTLTTKVGGLVEGYGAKKAGIEAGDRIIAVDGKKVTYWEELQEAIREKAHSGTVRISFIRNNEEKNLEIKIRENSFEDILGQKRTAGMIGVMPSDEILKVRHGPVKSFLLALNKTYDLTVMTYKALWRMITGRLSMRESVTGPLGIFYITSQAAGMGMIAVIHLVALLSVSLCIFNLLPLPVLDGGHILFLAIEKIRGRSLGEKAERVIVHIGLSLIITLAVLVSLNDLVKFGYVEKVIGFFK